jgi:NAD(P)-dependent dehydrogenase (short-subunit alcohol dehydrogenase family)
MKFLVRSDYFSCTPFLFATPTFTGAIHNRGIGLFAAKILRRQNPGHRLILVSRTLEKAQKARIQVDSVLLPSEVHDATQIDVLACDQSSLCRVREFAGQLRDLFQVKNNPTVPSGLDVLCLNAAMMAPMDSQSQFTDDEFEVTFETNHLAPFLIVNLVHSLLNPGGRVIFTTSGLHAFVSFNNFRGMMGVAPTRVDMIDGKPFHYKAAYSLSKLSNTTCCVALNKKLEQSRGRRDVVVNCFTPGLIPSTGLFQHSDDSPCLMTNIASTLEHGGGALAWMATSDEAGREGGLFYQTQPGTSHEPPGYGTERFCPSPIPEDAKSVSNQEKLWEISAQLVGIEPVLKGTPDISRGYSVIG